MLKFFRQIRKTLIENLPAGHVGNKIRTYLLYAIGEVFLVVIGILIALQVNNWNEERKQNLLEKEILSEISRDLESGILSLENDIDLNENIIRSIDIVLTALESNQTYQDSLALHFGELVFYTTISVNTSGYDNLKNNGFQIIREDSLRKSITEFYTNSYSFLLRYEEKDRLVTMEYFSPKYLDYIENIEEQNPPGFTGLFTPINFGLLKEDIEFKKLLHYLRLNKREMILNINISLNEMRVLQSDLDQYIGRISS